MHSSSFQNNPEVSAKIDEDVKKCRPSSMAETVVGGEEFRKGSSKSSIILVFALFFRISLKHRLRRQAPSTSGAFKT